MATSIDQLNYYDDLVKKGSYKMSPEWINTVSSHIDTLNGYLTPFGIIVPNITVAQQSTIQSPVEGQMVYVVDVIASPRTAQLQIWQVKAGTAGWRVVTTV